MNIDKIRKLARQILAKNELRSHLPNGFVSYTGEKWADNHVRQYNELQDKMNDFVKEGKDIPENLLNSSHKLMAMYSSKY
jgi:hypothetical protein